MTLLTVAQEVADVIGITRPTALVSSTDQLSRQMLGLAKETLEELGLMDWPILEIPYTFNTADGVSQYTLPTDFGREIGDSVYLAGRYESLRGSVTPGQWQRQRSSLQANLGQYRFRIFGLPLQLNLTPTPTVVEAVTMEYQTTYRVQQVDTTYKTTFFADTDVSLMPEELLKKGLKWRMLRAKGADYSEEFNDYEMSRAARLAQQLQFGSSPVAQRYMGDEASGLYIPESGFG
jgi:hypothetical protein